MYKMEMKKLEMSGPGDRVVYLLKVGFGEQPATNDKIVKFVDATAPQANGGLLLINGRASLPVAMVLTHKYSHVFESVAVYDPKLSGYVVVINHGPNFEVGQLLKFD